MKNIQKRWKVWPCSHQICSKLRFSRSILGEWVVSITLTLHRMIPPRSLTDRLDRLDLSRNGGSHQAACFLVLPCQKHLPVVNFRTWFPCSSQAPAAPCLLPKELSAACVSSISSSLISKNGQGAHFCTFFLCRDFQGVWISTSLAWGVSAASFYSHFFPGPGLDTVFWFWLLFHCCSSLTDFSTLGTWDATIWGACGMERPFIH